MRNLAAAAYCHAVAAKNAAVNKVRRDAADLAAGRMEAQGLIEYVLIIAVISIIVIWAGPQVATAIGKQFDKIAEYLTKGSTQGGIYKP